MIFKDPNKQRWKGGWKVKRLNIFKYKTVIGVQVPVLLLQMHFINFNSSSADM